MNFDFVQLPAQPQDELGLDPYDRWLTPNGGVAALFHRTGDGFLLRFPGRADFALSRKTLHVTCTPVPEASPQLVIDLFHNQVVPLILNRTGELVMHASAVAAGCGALAFLGQSGRGKSTLAASLALAGHPFLTDDGLLLKPVGHGYTINPNRPYLRLWSDSDNALFGRQPAETGNDGNGKTLVDAGPSLPFGAHAERLDAIYLLGSGASEIVAIERLNPAFALSELIKHAFILDVEDQLRLHAHFNRIVQLAETIACFTLDYPRRYDALPRVTDAILAHAQSGECRA